jgi:proton-dependent oligopeptide transporter, POT family
MAKHLEQQSTLFGHPTGLFTLFFAEMWERFSYYGMRALLILYIIKGFLGYGDQDANAVYGAYTALVYMTPFFGGLIADKLLGSRTCVIIGGLLMSAGHLLMTIENDLGFFTALGLLIVGNGFFKPNISTIVGTLYPQGSPKRDGGFTIFYIGINLGAAMAPLLCGYIGETYGWHYGFGLATIGMLVGVAIFAAPTIVTQVLILGAALLSAYGLFFYKAGDTFSLISNSVVAIALLISGGIAIAALQKGGLPAWAGGSPKPEVFWQNLTKVLLGTIICIPVLVILVSGFSVLPGVDGQYQVIGSESIESLETSESPLVRGLAEFVKEASRPAGIILIIAGLGATIYLLREAFSMDKIARERMYVVFILTFFMFVFWAFFEQSGSSVNNFTDRNVDRVFGAESVVSEDQVGQTQRFRLVADPSNEANEELTFFTQAFLGRENGSSQFDTELANAIRAVEANKEESKRMDEQGIQAEIKKITEYKVLTMSGLTYLREAAKLSGATAQDKTVTWTFTEENVGTLRLGGSEVPASVYQAVNPIYIMIFGLVFTFLWTFLGERGWEPSTPVKFAFGLVQLGLGFSMLYFGAQTSNNGMVNSLWLLAMYLLLTTGELCSSPVGLSMVTKLTPSRLVSTVMGAWFLATAFSQFLAAIIAQFAAVQNEDGSNFVPEPSATVHLYGDVYKLVAIMAAACGLVCLIMSPILTRWMHIGEQSMEDIAEKESSDN